VNGPNRALPKLKGDLLTLKKTYSIAICILLLCSSLLLISVGTVKANNASYTITEYWGAAVTVDGKWTSADEWHDTTVQQLGASTNQGKWEYKVASADYVVFDFMLLVEFADSTNDAGDVWQLCVGTASTNTNPAATDSKFEITGHTTLTTYVGTGTAWSSTANLASFKWKDTITTSPHDPANHYVLELDFDKGVTAWGVVAPPDEIRIAYYDASNPSQGWVSWPPASTADNPNSWGTIGDYSMAAAPEGLTVGLMLALSAVAVVVSTRYFRKPPKL
jgi:hypothetical protein